MIDVIHIHRGTLHLKSSLYPRLRRASGTLTIDRNEQSEETEIPMKTLPERIKEFFSRYLATDTTGWIIRKMMSECAEFVIQSLAFLQYNGYNLSDPHHEDGIYLALKPEFVCLFAGVLCFNTTGSGLAWLSYSLFPGHCFGHYFKRTLFLVDNFCDLMYSVFPILAVSMDDYNSGTDDLSVLVGMLSVDSWSTFIATAFPMFMLCNQCIAASISSQKIMRNNHFEIWKSRQRQFRLKNNKNVVVDAMMEQQETNWINRTDAADWKYKRTMKRVILILISSGVIVYGLFMFIFTLNHTATARAHCGSVTESQWTVNGLDSLDITMSDEQRALLESNPELFVWNHCLYRVYPFGGDECQCRVFVLDWNELTSSESERVSLHLPQSRILEGILTRWTMLEKFKTIGWNAGVDPFVFTDNMFNAKWMRAFEWKGIRTGSLPNAVSQWKHLEYLSFEDTENFGALPPEFGVLTNLKSLILTHSGIDSFPESLCNLINLEVLQLYSEYWCISTL